MKLATPEQLTVGKTIWCTVRTENTRSLKFMDKVGFVKVGDIAWGKTKQIPGVILKRTFKDDLL